MKSGYETKALDRALIEELQKRNGLMTKEQMRKLQNISISDWKDREADKRFMTQLDMRLRFGFDDHSKPDETKCG